MGSKLARREFRAFIRKETVAVCLPPSGFVPTGSAWVLRVRSVYPDGTSRVLVMHPFSDWEAALISGNAWVRHYRKTLAQRTR